MNGRIAKRIKEIAYMEWMTLPSHYRDTFPLRVIYKRFKEEYKKTRSLKCLKLELLY